MQKNKQTHPRTEKNVTEQNGTEQKEPKGTERNKTKQKGTERNRKYGNGQDPTWSGMRRRVVTVLASRTLSVHSTPEEVQWNKNSFS